MMNFEENPAAVVCSICGQPYTLPEDDVEGNIPRMLLCGHVYCSSCLRSMEQNSVITCPQCEVESMLTGGGVDGLMEDCRIIGLIYTAKMNKKRSNCSSHHRDSEILSQNEHSLKEDNSEQPADLENFEQEVDEALVQAAENLAQLEHVQKTLKTGLSKQVTRERARMESEIHQSTSKAIHCIQKWKDRQLEKLSKLESHFSTTQSQIAEVEERVRTLQIAIQKAREVRRVPFLGKYCPLDKVLETLQAPVDNQFDIICLSEGSGLRYALQSQTISQSLMLCLDVYSKQQSKGSKLDSPTQRPQRHKALCRSTKMSTATFLGGTQNPGTQSPGTKSPGTRSPSSDDSFSPLSRSSSISCHGSTLGIPPPDIIYEEVVEHGLQQVSLSPSGPELANEKTRTRKRKTPSPSYTRAVTQWVVVTHIVNPNHFYVQYVAEKKEGEILSKKINQFCSRGNNCLSTRHTLDTGSLIFVRFEDGLWYRARVVEVFQAGIEEALKSCPVVQISTVHVFFIDTGLTTAITIKSGNRESVTLLKAINHYMRRVTDFAMAELDSFVPQAIRCSLKDLVPYDPTKGWTKEAQVEFRSMVDSTTVKMQTLGQDKHALLVDLRKVPANRASGPNISIREHLVFIEVARFYSPVTVSQKPLLYSPPVIPKINIELNAVVSYIRNPGDFYVQLVDNMESLILTDKLQKCYNAPLVPGEEDLHIYCPVIGEACVALFDKMWYRAQITGHPGGRKVEVVYVDFGNKKILPVTDLRKIKDEFFTLPAMAISCSLSDVNPLDGRTWNEVCTSRFIGLADQKLVTLVATAKGPKNGPLPVKLFESGLNGPLNNIGEQLAKEELACLKDRFSVRSRKSSCNDPAVWDSPLGSNDSSMGGDEAPGASEFQPQLKLPSHLKDVKVRVSYVNSPSSFYVQFTKYDSWLKRVCEMLKQECAHKEPEDMLWKEGMYCAAHINGVWERAQICTDVLTNNIAEVIRCDHGNKAKLHISNLLPLPPKLIGALALECTLCDIRPAGGRSTWTATACDFISFYLTGASAILTAKEVNDERPVPVTLSCSNTMGQFVSIADSLVSQGLALRERKPKSEVPSPGVENPKECAVMRTQPVSPDGDKQKTTPNATSKSISPQFWARPIPAPRSIVTTEMVTTTLYQPPELPCPGHLQMTVSAIGDDGTIYARTPNAERQLDQLKNRIQQSMKCQPNHKMYSWKTVQGCAIYGPDMLWYRGHRLEVLGGHVKVQYIDYGHVESIPAIHVYPSLLFEAVPQLCLPCELHGIHPVGGHWQRDAVALFSELLLNRSVDVHILEMPDDTRGPLSVEIFVDGLSLSRIMSENHHGSLEKPSAVTPVISGSLFLDDWDLDTEGLLVEEQVLGSFKSPELPPEGEEFPVRVKHLWTPNELFLWPLEGMGDTEVDGETLDVLLNSINDNIDQVPRLNCFTQGGPCLAEYSDGKYYRAKILDISSLEPLFILVQHVDYGSDDTLSPSKLRQMPPELLHFPTRVLKVKVAGFKAPSVNRQDDMLPYSPGWSIRAAMDMIDLLHGYIIASVVVREPELTVHLFNEKGEPVHIPLVNSGLAELD